MKFFFGLITGLVVGGFVATNSSEQQRRRARAATSGVVRRVMPTQVGQAVDDNASKVMSTAGGRVADAVDTVGDTVSSAIAPDTAHSAN